MTLKDTVEELQNELGKLRVMYQKKEIGYAEYARQSDVIVATTFNKGVEVGRVGKTTVTSAGKDELYCEFFNCDSCRDVNSMITEYYLYYVKQLAPDEKPWEDLSWHSEEGELETAVELYEKQSKDHPMRLYVIYRQNHTPKNIKKLIRTNVEADLALLNERKLSDLSGMFDFPNLTEEELLD